MPNTSRRRFLQGSAAATLLGAQVTSMSAEQPTASKVFMDQDGLGLTTTEVSAQLAKLCAQREPDGDTYMQGGEVEEVEKYFAKVLGKERAVFMPTGTLANQLALRALAGNRRRVLLQDVSHVYNDTGDASQTLSQLTLLPLAPEQSTFTWTDVERALNRTTSGRVRSEVGAICIESPVRRRAGELFDRAEMIRTCAGAKQRGIGTHLDGARLFMACAYTGLTPAEYAAPFDTVYVSMWKYFNAINGAILAGPASLLDGMYHTRRMFGGALFNAWPFALLARHYAEGFIGRLQSAIAASRTFMSGLPKDVARVETIPNGTNIFRITVAEALAHALPERMRQRDVILGKPVIGPQGGTFNILVNESWNRANGADLALRFRSALQT